MEAILIPKVLLKVFQLLLYKDGF